jgi:hypothetical protein
MASPASHGDDHRDNTRKLSAGCPDIRVLRGVDGYRVFGGGTSPLFGRSLPGDVDSSAEQRGSAQAGPGRGRDGEPGGWECPASGALYDEKGGHLVERA